MHKQEIIGKFLVGNQLWQVISKKIKKDNHICYEIFYFPIKRESEDKHIKIFQETAYELAKQKEYDNTDWIKHISDDHAKTLITCLHQHEHTIKPAKCCPFLDCKFHECHSDSGRPLDRRAYHRTQIDINGNLRLLTVNQQPASKYLAGKSINCRALDISLGGLKLELDNPLPLESQIEITLPGLTCKATTVWGRKHDDKYLIGVQFEQLDSEQRSNVIKIMSKYRLVVN